MEIVQFGVQRPGTARIGLHAKLIDLDSGTCRLAVAWPLGGEERHFDASDECLRAFRRVIEPEGFRVLCQGARPNVRDRGRRRQLSSERRRRQPQRTTTEGGPCWYRTVPGIGMFSLLSVVYLPVH